MRNLGTSEVCALIVVMVLTDQRQTQWGGNRRFRRSVNARANGRLLQMAIQ